jgi:hypothetical protein
MRDEIISIAPGVGFVFCLFRRGSFVTHLREGHPAARAKLPPFIAY